MMFLRKFSLPFALASSSWLISVYYPTTSVTFTLPYHSSILTLPYDFSLSYGPNILHSYSHTTLYLDVTYFGPCLSCQIKTSEGWETGSVSFFKMKEERDSLHWWIFLCHYTSNDRDRPLLKGRQCRSPLFPFHLKMDEHALSEKLWVISLRRQTISKILVTCFRTHCCHDSLKLNILPATSL